VIALGMTGVASAAMYAPPAAATGCMAGDVNVPCEKRGWSFAADALYVQANNAGQVTSTTTATDTSVNTDYQSYQPDWTWGFRFAAAYYFGTGNDLNLNWTHFVKQSDNQNVSGEGIDGLYITQALASDETVDNIATDVENKFDAVNLEFGQMVHFGEKVDTRFHAGLQYANIHQTTDQTGWNTDNNNIYDENNVESKFSGFGPRFGMDSAYNFGNGMAVFGNVAAALLVGDIKYNQTETFTAADGSGDTAATVSSSATSDNSIVPSADAKLGLRYTKSLAQGDLSAEVGYEVANYWNSVSTTSETTDADTTSFGYDGIFFGLKWMGNV